MIEIELRFDKVKNLRHKLLLVEIRDFHYREDKFDETVDKVVIQKLIFLP